MRRSLHTPRNGLAVVGERGLLRHPLEGPRTTLSRRFYPMGFPVDVETNSAPVLKIMDDMWSLFTARFDAGPIYCEVVVAEGTEVSCPPSPRYHIQLPILTTICDGDNFSVVDLERNTVQIHITRNTLNYPLFTGQFLLSGALACIATRYTTPVHGASVSWNSCGFLLCGDSGAGKSSLAYACARNGWTFTADDASYLMNRGEDRTVIGNCHQVRLRPQSAALFPEIAGLKMAARAAGKPSVEVPTNTIPGLIASPTAQVDYIVFLNREHDGPAVLTPLPVATARQSMLATLYGVPRMLRLQYAAIDRLLTVPVFEMKYKTLEEAMDLLRELAEQGYR